jgi:HK97 family phage portal protein
MAFWNKKEKRNFINGNISFTSNSDIIAGRDSTSFACVDLIATAVANLIGSFYTTETRQVIKDHYLYELINFPNADETKFQFMYNSIKDYFNGNIYWYKYIIDNRVVALFRLDNNKITVSRNSFNQKVYHYNGREYTSDNILHIPSRYGYDGLKGKSIFDECRSIFNTMAELDSYVNNSFNNSIGNRLVIDITKEYPDATEEQINQLKNQFMQNYSGIKNAGKPLIKKGKIDYIELKSEFKDNRSNQLMENREFQEKEIAKLFGIPLSILKGVGPTGSSQNDIESLYILFLENAIRPLATQIEQSINKLIPMNERGKIYFEFNYNALMKTSLQTRIDTYSKQITNGILTVNEVRRKENLSEITEAGDTLFLQANLMPLTPEVIEAYMAKSKLLTDKNIESPDTQGDHDNKGDDKI